MGEWSAVGGSVDADRGSSTAQHVHSYQQQLRTQPRTTTRRSLQGRAPSRTSVEQAGADRDAHGDSVSAYAGAHPPTLTREHLLFFSCRVQLPCDRPDLDFYRHHHHHRLVSDRASLRSSSSLSVLTSPPPMAIVENLRRRTLSRPVRPTTPASMVTTAAATAKDDQESNGNSRQHEEHANRYPTQPNDPNDPNVPAHPSHAFLSVSSNPSTNSSSTDLRPPSKFRARLQRFNTLLSPTHHHRRRTTSNLATTTTSFTTNPRASDIPADKAQRYQEPSLTPTTQAATKDKTDVVPTRTTLLGGTNLMSTTSSSPHYHLPTTSKSHSSEPATEPKTNKTRTRRISLAFGAVVKRSGTVQQNRSSPPTQQQHTSTRSSTTERSAETITAHGLSRPTDQQALTTALRAPDTSQVVLRPIEPDELAEAKLPSGSLAFPSQMNSLLVAEPSPGLDLP